MSLLSRYTRNYLPGLSLVSRRFRYYLKIGTIADNRFSRQFRPRSYDSIYANAVRLTPCLMRIKLKSSSRRLRERLL